MLRFLRGSPIPKPRTIVKCRTNGKGCYGIREAQVNLSEGTWQGRQWGKRSWRAQSILLEAEVTATTVYVLSFTYTAYYLPIAERSAHHGA
jgi:hypothetical protein